jgi:pimeloyl-ACP methyl ester carboxylesterase
MLGLRIAVAPVVGRPVRRYLLPAVLPLFRDRILEGMLHPNPVPPWLRRFPLEHAVRGPSVRTMAAELRCFNDGMIKVFAGKRVVVPTTAIFGEADRTAPRSWHEPWLKRHVEVLRVIRLPGVGHAVHHADPRSAIRSVQE